MAAADKLPQCSLHISWDSRTQVFLCKCCYAFCQAKKGAVWRSRCMWQTAGCHKVPPFGPGRPSTHLFRMSPELPKGLSLLCCLWVKTLHGWPPADFTGVNATSYAENVVGELGLAATPSRQPLHCEGLPFLRQEELQLVFLMSVSPFLFFWHEFLPTANRCLAKERKCSIFTGTGNKGQKDPLQ